MSQTLCLDFGNSRYKCALIQQGTVEQEWLLEKNPLQQIADIVAHYAPKYAILSSVVNHDSAIEKFLAEHTIFHKLSHESKLPVTPATQAAAATVGADRWALLAGATALYPKQHNLVIGLGSCITYNFVNKFGVFLGGAIAPGLYMRSNALHQYTDKLPVVDLEWNVPLIGYNTQTNIQSGIILGITYEIDGFIDAYKKKYDGLNVLLTGGDASFFLPHLKNKIFAEEHLIYKGLYVINQLNSK